MKKPSPEQLIYVEWLDHHANGGWTDEVDHTPAVCKSVGWLVKEDGKAITLAASYNVDTSRQYGNTQYILKNCIVARSRKRIKL